MQWIPFSLVECRGWQEGRSQSSQLHEVDSNGEEHLVDEENQKKLSPNNSPHLQLLLKKTLVIQREPPRTHESVK